jgi:hypothetical protein
MADVTVTAADVRPLPGAVVMRFNAGGTLTPGQAVYVASDGDVEAADADAAASAIVLGIVVAGPNGKVSFSAGERVDVVVLGPVTGFSGMTPGGHAFVSTDAGDIGNAAPAGSSGDYVYVVGLITAADTILVRPFTYSVAAQ